MSRKVVEIPVEVWEFSLQDAEHIVALHRETLRLMNENASLKANVESLTKAGDAMAEAFDLKYPVAGGLINAWNAAKEGNQP